MTGIDAAQLNFSPASLHVLNAILGIVMFSVAIDLRLSDFRALLRRPKPIFVGAAAQFLVLPALTFLLVMALRPSPSIALGLILVASCPGGNVSNFFTHRAGGNTALSVSLTALATVAALLMTPINIALWGSLYAPTRALLTQTRIDPVSVAITVGVMLLVPLAAGIALNHYRPAVTACLRRPLKWLSMGIFAAFILMSLRANWAYFLEFVGVIAGLVVLHNALAFAGGFATATLARLPAFDRRAVTIETGIQNSGLGLVLIFAFFGGMGGMAIVAAFWGIWHIIAGFAISTVFSRREAAR
ncbi:bile acid:sodium symporter family protein [Aliishimia ponticola]|uniref:Bile acid:sodium symporter family protein n=1 Tax=Aliishimia ponticola TaxID=2499833 RepID=A0A4V3XK08_9RHOB|nr:bile acid:sodium symporter family protein [Aliishimia ponticola]THH35143.1 bile acid:sodium symporter family protein [Aliishimia ponticola]